MTANQGNHWMQQQLLTRSCESDRFSTLQRSLDVAMELPSKMARRDVEVQQDSSQSSCILLDSPPKRKRRGILEDVTNENEPVQKKDCKKEVSPQKENVGGNAENSLLLSSRTTGMHWCNGIWNGRSLRELYSHCNSIVSGTQRLIHDILPDPDGRRINMLLDHLANTRKPNGLWLITLHRRGGPAHELELPGTLPSRSEAIETARIISGEYGCSPDRHAHIVHICPWASNSCRCKPLQGVGIKRRNRPSRAWRVLSEQHFKNIIEYLLRSPRQLCLFEIACAPVDITLPRGENVGLSIDNTWVDNTWEPVWPAASQVLCGD